MSLGVKCTLATACVVLVTIAAGVGYYMLNVSPEHLPLPAVAADIITPALQRLVLFQLAIGLAAGVLWSIYFNFNIAGTLRRLAEHLQRLDLGGGPLPESGIHRKDETGRVAAEVDQFSRRAEASLEKCERRARQLKESDERCAAAFRASGDGLWDWNLATNKVYVSAQFHALLRQGKKAGAVPLEEWLESIFSEDREATETSLRAFAESQTGTLQTEQRLLRQGSEPVWTLCRAVVTPGVDGSGKHIVGLVTDITPQKEREAQLAHEATHDVLTGLANRAMLVQQLDFAVARVKRGKYRFGLLFMDLDRFKVVNDGLGHLVGDILLKGVSERIHSSVRATDTVGRCQSTVARLGGDEFVVLLDDVYDVMDAIRVAERIKHAVMKPFSIQGNEIYTSTSIGIAMSNPDTESGAEILRNADTALYRAKALGKARYAVFDTEMGNLAKRRLRLETDLRKAIANEELHLNFQPIIDLRTGKIGSFEVLVRWNHPEFGLVSPDEFIAIAEETDTIQAMAMWLLRTAAKNTRQWQMEFPHAKTLDVNINLSSKDFLQDNLVTWVREALEIAGLAPEHLKVEVTETLLTKHGAQVQDRLKELRAEGIQLAIDDFGTGYSSLSQLTKFAVESVKIDTSFIREMHSSPESLQLVRSILALSQSMSLRVIAEGVEEKHQLERLRGLSCDFGQGYLFSKPVDFAAATRLLATSPTW